MSCCVGCNKLKKGCNVGCMDYLLQSLTTPKEMKIVDGYTAYSNTRIKKWSKQHIYLGGNNKFIKQVVDNSLYYGIIK